MIVLVDVFAFYDPLECGFPHEKAKFRKRAFILPAFLLFSYFCDSFAIPGSSINRHFGISPNSRFEREIGGT